MQSYPSSQLISAGVFSYFSLEGGEEPSSPHRERPMMQSQAVVLPSCITPVPSILPEYFEQQQQKCKLDLFAAVCTNDHPRENGMLFLPRHPLAEIAPSSENFCVVLSDLV